MIQAQGVMYVLIKHSMDSQIIELFIFKGTFKEMLEQVPKTCNSHQPRTNSRSPNLIYFKTWNNCYLEL